MKRDDEERAARGVAEADMASPLSSYDPSGFAERGDQLGAGYDRLAGAQAGRGSVRRTTPISSGLPSSRKPST
jgi:hypothetical protein